MFSNHPGSTTSMAQETRSCAHGFIEENIFQESSTRSTYKLKYKKIEPCTPCQFGKQVRTSFKAKNQVSSTDPLQLLHLDLFGPERYVSLGGKKYAFVIVDDFSRFTWVLFLRSKDEAFNEFQDLISTLKPSIPRSSGQSGAIMEANLRKILSVTANPEAFLMNFQLHVLHNRTV